MDNIDNTITTPDVNPEAAIAAGMLYVPVVPTQNPTHLMAANAATALSSVARNIKVSDGPDDLPQDPDDQSFDITVPDDFNAMLRKFYKFVYYSSKGNPVNFNIYTNMAAYMLNMMNKMTPDQRAKFNSIVNSDVQIIDPNTGNVSTLGKLIGEDLVYGKYYTSGQSQSAADNYATMLQQMFGGSAGGNVWTRDIIEGIQRAQASLPVWVTTPQAQMNMSDFFMSQCALGAQITCSDQMQSFFNLFHHNEVTQLLAGIKDPQLALMILMTQLIIPENDDTLVSVGGYGTLMNQLSKMAALANKILADFKQMQADTEPPPGQTTGGSVSIDHINTFLSDLKRFHLLFGANPNLASAFQQVDDVYLSIFGGSKGSGEGAPPATNAISLPDGVGYGDIQSFGDLIQCVDVWHTASPDRLIDAFTKIMPQVPQPGSTTPTQVPPQYSSILQNTQQLAVSCTNSSSMTGTQAQQAQGYLDKATAFIAAYIKQWSDLVAHFGQNKQSV